MRLCLLLHIIIDAIDHTDTERRDEEGKVGMDYCFPYRFVLGEVVDLPIVYEWGLEEEQHSIGQTLVYLELL